MRPVIIKITKTDYISGKLYCKGCNRVLCFYNKFTGGEISIKCKGCKTINKLEKINTIALD